MGLRGPGAKPIRKPTEKAPSSRAKRPKWKRKGLPRAERVIAFIEGLKITAGVHAGRPFKLRDWQKEIIRRAYGPVGDDGRRLVRTALVTFPRKNGKTQLAAGLALAHLCGPEAEPRGQILSGASDRDQAAILFREMVAMIEADEELSERVIVRHFKKELEDAENKSVYQALSSDARKAHGLSPSFAVCDEVAQWKGRELFDNIVTGTAARAEPLVVVISTMSSDPHSVMSELVSYGQQVRDGIVDDPTFAPTIYSAPMDADPWDEAVWHACNPALGDFRSLEEMRAYADQAKRIPAREAVFRNLYLNQPVESEARFIAPADWDACNAPVDPEALRGRPCWAGLDLSSTTDLSACVLYFPEDAGAVLPFFWVPGDRLRDREERDKVPYWTWKQQGFIEAPAGRAIDKWAIVYRLAEIASAYDVRGVAFDRWRIEDLKKLLSDEGINLPLVDWGQGFKDMAPAVDAMETAILAGRLRHGGHPVLRWNISNCVVQVDPAGARKIAKDKSIERVDGAVALCMAVGLHAREPGPVEYDFDRPLVLSV